MRRETMMVAVALVGGLCLGAMGNGRASAQDPTTTECAAFTIPTLYYRPDRQDYKRLGGFPHLGEGADAAPVGERLPPGWVPVGASVAGAREALVVACKTE